MTFSLRLALCLPTIFCGLLCAGHAQARDLFGLELPGAASETGRHSEAASAEPFPVRAYQGVDTPRIMAEGDIERVAYRLSGTSLTSHQMISALREQLEAQGFDILFSCADTVCGGFDFRYLLDLLPEPAMHVDLGDYQYLVAQDDSERVVSVLTSRAPTSGFVQITTVVPSDAPPVELTQPDSTDVLPQLAQPTGALATQLESRGRVVLGDLAFDTGAATLGAGPFASLQSLASYLMTHPEVRIVLVGHTDNVGALDSNTALSRKRAQSVRQRLISRYGVSSAQISAEGIGYLAPLVSNSSEDGREQNRRVEAVIASTQ